MLMPDWNIWCRYELNICRDKFDFLCSFDGLRLSQKKKKILEKNGTQIAWKSCGDERFNSNLMFFQRLDVNLALVRAWHPIPIYGRIYPYLVPLTNGFSSVACFRSSINAAWMDINEIFSINKFIEIFSVVNKHSTTIISQLVFHYQLTLQFVFRSKLVSLAIEVSGGPVRSLCSYVYY